MNRKLKSLLIAFVMCGSVHADSAYVLREMESLTHIETDESEGLMFHQTCTSQPDPASSEGWLSYGQRMISSFGDAAYQLYVSNRFFGLESGSCQSWTSLLNVKSLQNQWKNGVISDINILINDDKSSLISTSGCDDVLSKGWESDVLKSALAVSKNLQKTTGVKRVYLPFNLYLTNTLTGAPIMHRVALETTYNSSRLQSVRIIDPQTGLSGGYLSNASALCEKAFSGISKTVFTEYVAAGVQLPGTGNCQKMAAYLAVESAKGTAISDLSIKEANAFCTTVHASNEKSSKAEKFANVLKSSINVVFSMTRKLSSWFTY